MSGHGWEVVVVEDDNDNREVVTEALHLFQSDAHVTAFADGSEYLAEMEHLSPTLVILDLALPKVDGWTTLEAIRENPATASVPVVAVTGYHSAKVEHAALEAGFDAFFAKPIDIFSFGAQLAMIIGR
jgi:CheY-like chemotaxis protein